MKILSVCRGQPQRLDGSNTKTGIVKEPLSGPVMVDAEGLVGDAILNRKYHGGPDQAIYLEGALTLRWWEEELGRPIPPGLFGENIVIDGLDNRDLAVGDRLMLGEVLLEVTAPRTPCSTFNARMEDRFFAKRYTKAKRPGGYCRVLQGGLVETGLRVEHRLAASDRLMLAELLGVSFKSIDPQQRARFLAAPIAQRLRQQIGDLF
ncbi:MOSC domain-containing protein [Allorhizobium taibaishanense]|uniref:MOSC domain-containing protein YiiM n=1 Tax=Allorhizobium taibaishanense TaxID=887144 RepID=A0A1Q9A958_9HYPH|nr:MOSC domain-containing protein [Allorhizobium taibaishanense]MBB4009706.1 MOSC domain-containing protein YiiM [Allorhizobium taibaishanense]OLP51110.1 molybdenum cofactor biosysynthesis protein [Allorhizobium taibaishanense]